MSAVATSLSILSSSGERLFRLSVAQYHAMIADGILTDEHPVELLDGLLVFKMPKNPLHEAVIVLLADLLSTLLPTGWSKRAQSLITLDESEPEPDLVIHRGKPSDYFHRHPGPGDIAAVIEVADSSLTRDRTTKLAIYARAGIPTYWIVNLEEGVIEAHTEPDRAAGTYRCSARHRRADTVTLTIDSQPLTPISVSSLLP